MIDGCEFLKVSESGHEIVWLVKPEDYHYFRETSISGNHYNFSPKKILKFLYKWAPRTEIICAYENPKPWKDIPVNGIGKWQEIRVWYLRPYDFDCDNEGIYKYAAPSEAIYPCGVGYGKGFSNGYNSELSYHKKISGLTRHFNRENEINIMEDKNYKHIQWCADHDKHTNITIFDV